MLKISGLTELTKQFEDAQRALHALDGNIATVKFNPNDEASVQVAIREMQTAIDSKMSPYRGNALVESIVPKLKEKYRAAILERARSEAKSAS